MRIRCRIPFPVVVQEEAEQFLFPAGEKEFKEEQDIQEDALVSFEMSESLPAIPEKAVFYSDRFYSRDESGRYQIHFCSCPGQPPYACTRWEQDEGETLKITCSYLPGNEFRFGYSRLISDHISLETLFLRKKGLMLHSSFIRWKENGILFTAPSGTGKSTQAELWEKFEGADILNGDRSAVRKDEKGNWQAYGLPYAGSSGIYRNEKAPLRTIIVLRQAKENRIRRLKALEIIENLYPETTIHHWEKEFIEQALTLLTELAGTVPFYLLECRPDRGAVETVKNVLTGGED